jgi:hypothetical protein
MASSAPSERCVFLFVYPGFRCASPWAKLWNRFAVYPTHPRVFHVSPLEESSGLGRGTFLIDKRIERT